MTSSDSISGVPPFAASNGVAVEPTRVRQTAPPESPFRDILLGGTTLLSRGAEVATHVLAGPVMAAAVRNAGADAVRALATAPAPRGAAPSPGTSPVGAGSDVAGLGNRGNAPGLGNGGNAAGLELGATGDQVDMATMVAMQRESQAFNLQLLALQEDVQQENRRFSTLSNVLRAKHDTAKAAVANIRS